MAAQQEYLPPILTVDTVIFQIISGVLSVLLIMRSSDPFKGSWALPGGYNPAGETTHDAMKRILKTKAGLDVEDIRYVEQLYTFDTVARDPRGHAVSVTYMALSKDLEPRQSKTTQKPTFYPVTALPKTAYDHQEIVKYAHERLQAKLSYTNAIYALLPKLFTLSQLQIAYEAVLCTPLDKRNFRKKFLSLDLIQKTGEMHREGAHRPAHLYEFTKQSLEILPRSFD